jgi:hypothetical protein
LTAPASTGKSASTRSVPRTRARRHRAFSALSRRAPAARDATSTRLEGGDGGIGLLGADVQENEIDQRFEGAAGLDRG